MLSFGDLPARFRKHEGALVDDSKKRRPRVVMELYDIGGDRWWGLIGHRKEVDSHFFGFKGGCGAVDHSSTFAISCWGLPLLALQDSPRSPA